MDLKELYQEIILDHGKNPRNLRKGENFNKDAKGHNPLCGDKVHIYLVTSSERERDKERAKEFKELTGYVVKPVSEDNLVEILTEVYENQW